MRKMEIFCMSVMSSASNNIPRPMRGIAIGAFWHVKINRTEMRMRHASSCDMLVRGCWSDRSTEKPNLSRLRDQEPPIALIRCADRRVGLRWALSQSQRGGSPSVFLLSL